MYIPVFSDLFLIFIDTHITLSKLQDECSGQHILLKRTGENVRYCLLKDVKAIAEQVICMPLYFICHHCFLRFLFISIFLFSFAPLI